MADYIFTQHGNNNVQIAEVRMMERLTKNFKGAYGLVKVKDNEQEIESPYRNTLQACFESWQQLGRYEDTGLTPDEIAALRTRAENNQTCYVSEAAEAERLRIENAALLNSSKLLESDRDAERKIRLAAEAELAALKAELDGYKALLSSVHELADAEKFEEVTDMIDTVLPTIGRAALEGGPQ